MNIDTGSKNITYTTVCKRKIKVTRKLLNKTNSKKQKPVMHVTQKENQAICYQ